MYIHVDTLNANVLVAYPVTVGNGHFRGSEAWKHLGLTCCFIWMLKGISLD